MCGLLGDATAPGWKADLALLPLILSCFGSYWATEGAKKNTPQMLTGMMEPGSGAFVPRVAAAEWRNFKFRLGDGLHASVSELLV